MPNEFILASAGAGKTTDLVSAAIEDSRNGRSVLILTYTRNNQSEIIQKIQEKNGYIPDMIRVKGWYTFLLEDMIRPYRQIFFRDRISNIIFDQKNPHKIKYKNKGFRYIPGRSAEIDKALNPKHYLSNNKAHTMFISKLATKICDAGKIGTGRDAKFMVIERLASIYDLIVIDEVQDLVGWDYEVLKKILSNQNLTLYCVGDFRQTIYETSKDSRSPRLSYEKEKWFSNNKFIFHNKNYSWRCVNSICEFADKVHVNQNYVPTKSNVKEISKKFENHLGVYAVADKIVRNYINLYNPTILRNNRNVRNDICEGNNIYNFGQSKGMTFDRVLIIPTGNYKKFLKGSANPFGNTDKETEMNKLYVAITRARYSVAFLYDEDPIIDGISVWTI